MSKKTKKVVFTKDLQYGLFEATDGKHYQFDYGHEKDNGLGVLQEMTKKYDEDFQTDIHEIIDDNHDALGNIESVIIKLNK